MNEEAENIGPVVDGDDDHALAGHVLSVIARLRTVPVLEAAAENIDQDGESLLVQPGGRPDVQVKAVLAHTVAAEPVVRAGRRPLHTSRPEPAGIADARPGFDGLRFAPAKFAYWWQGERNALETAHAVLRRGGGFQ